MSLMSMMAMIMTIIPADDEGCGATVTIFKAAIAYIILYIMYIMCLGV